MQKGLDFVATARDGGIFDLKMLDITQDVDFPNRPLNILESCAVSFRVLASQARPRYVTSNSASNPYDFLKCGFSPRRCIDDPWRHFPS